MVSRFALLAALSTAVLLLLPSAANATSGAYQSPLKLGTSCTQSGLTCAALSKQDMEQMDTNTAAQNTVTQVKTDSTCTTTCTATIRSMVGQTNLGYKNIDDASFPENYYDYGWIYDGFGGQTLPDGPWTFQAYVNSVSVSSNQRTGLHVNVWKVRLNGSGHPISSQLMASGTSNCSSGDCAVGAGAALVKATLAFPGGTNVSYTNRSLAPGEHLFVAFNLIFDTNNGGSVDQGKTRAVYLYNAADPTSINFGSTSMKNVTPAPQDLEILPNGSTASNGKTGGWFTTSSFAVRAYLNDPDWYHHDDFRICNSSSISSCGSNVVTSDSSTASQVITYPFTYANWTGISLSDGKYWLQARTAEDSATGYSTCSPATPITTPICATSDMTSDPTHGEVSTGYWAGYYDSPNGDQTPAASPNNATPLNVDTTAPSTSVSTSASSAAEVASGSSICYDPTGAPGTSFTIVSGASDATSGVDHIHFPAVSGMGSGGSSGASDESSSPYSHTYTFGSGSPTATGSQTMTAYDVAGNSNGDTFSLASDSSAPSSPTVTGGSSSWRDVSSAVASASGSTASGCSALADYEYETSTDGGSSWSGATVGSSSTVTAEGETLVRFRAYDTLGHDSTWVSATIRIDRSSPTAGGCPGRRGFSVAAVPV